MMQKMKPYVQMLAYLLSGLVIVLPLLRWGELLAWDNTRINPLTVFPLFGMWAFGLMWTHYILSGVKRHLPDAMDYAKWYRATSGLVLVLILLHPALLLYEANVGGFTPFDYVSDDNGIFILFGYLALAGFLMWEAVDKLRERPFIKRNMTLFSHLNNLAFVLVYFHGLSIGTHLQAGWLRTVWIFLGISGAFIILHNYYYAAQAKQAE